MASLHALSFDSRRLEARIVLGLAEVEQRRLHLKAACGSLFDFCVRRLLMSEGAAFRRINAARLVRRFSRLTGHLESGAVHLSTLVLLRDHFTESNVDELVAPGCPAAPPSLAAPRPAARVEPLSESRYKLQLTISKTACEKLERAKDLMRHRNPSGDLAVVVEQALDALLAKLERERLAKTSRPRGIARPTKKGRISAAVRREVVARDGERCTYVSERGLRCTSSAFLELDHITPRALGGPDVTENLRVVCRAHNRLLAEEVLGRKCVERGIHFRQRKSDTLAAANRSRLAGAFTTSGGGYGATALAHRIPTS